MKKTIYISLALTLFLLASAENSFACSCLFSDKPLNVQVKEAFNNSTAIFSGEVISITLKSEYEVTVKIKVEKSWKGKFSKEVTITTAKENSMCGYWFEIGKKYLVYANGPKDFLLVTNCSRTTNMSNKGDVKYLAKFKRQKRVS